MYHHVFVAGTFDRLHSGHKSLLRAAFEMGEKVTVGITSDKFVQEFKIKKDLLSPPAGEAGIQYSPLRARLRRGTAVFSIQRCVVRKRVVLEWLKTQGYEDRAVFVYIHTPYEPATTVVGVDALVITSQNRKTGEEINEKRKAKNLPPFHLIEVGLVPAEDEKPISSTRIRSGSIDEEGALVMPESLRSLLQKPLGKVLTGSDIFASIKNHESQSIITVGDMATKTVVDCGISPSFAIIDGMVARKRYVPSATLISNGLSQQSACRVRPCELCAAGSDPGETDKAHVVRVKSGPGFISTFAMEAIDSALALLKQSKHPSILLVVDGEEDLLVLPVIQKTKEGTVVYYGQPGKGLVKVLVTPSVKLAVRRLLQKFISKKGKSEA